MGAAGQGQLAEGIRKIHLSDAERDLLRLYAQMDADISSTIAAAGSSLGFSPVVAKHRLVRLLRKLGRQVVALPSPVALPTSQNASRERTPLDEIPISRAIQEVVPDHEEWLETPNSRLYGRKPSDLLEQGDEEPIREILRAAVYIGVS